MPQSQCSIDGCGTLSVCRGRCRHHYNQQYRGKPLTEAVAHAACKRCGNALTARRGLTYCSQRCREQAKYEAIRNDPERWAIYLERTRNAYVKKTEQPGYVHPNSKAVACSAEGCDDKHYAKGMCRLHYRRTVPRTPDKPKLVTCAMCGTQVLRMAGGYQHKYGPTCSNECRARITFGWSEPLPELHWARMYGATCAWKPPKPVEESPAFSTGYCKDCGTPFTQPAHWSQSLYCTDRCASRVARRRRRAREADAPGDFRYTEVIHVYLAQGKVCAYCEQPVVGLPDPEHVLPISRGGRNDITNLVASCRLCNTDKGDQTLEEWAADRARRRLPQVRTQLIGPAFKHLVAATPTRPAWRNLGAA